MSCQICKMYFSKSRNSTFVTGCKSLRLNTFTKHEVSNVHCNAIEKETIASPKHTEVPIDKCIMYMEKQHFQQLKNMFNIKLTVIQIPLTHEITSECRKCILDDPDLKYFNGGGVCPLTAQSPSGPREGRECVLDNNISQSGCPKTK